MDGLISREASDKTKGFRLQKLRAINLMLDLYNKDKATTFYVFYAAVEHYEDVAINYADDARSEAYLEEDKYYNPESGFTINSHEVKNSLVSFFDIYSAKWRHSKTLSFGFHSTNRIAKEGRPKVVEEAGLENPDKPVLELLSERNYSYPNLLPLVKFVLLKEYQRQYPERGGVFQYLEEISDDDLISFLDLIKWTFGGGDENVEQDDAFEKIRACPHFNAHLEGKEEIILSLLMEELDKRQGLAYANDKFVYSSDVELVYVQAAGEITPELHDPAWKAWEEIDADDTRNLKEKVESVFADCPSKTIRLLSHKAVSAKIEEREFKRSFKAMKYRVYYTSLEYISRRDFSEPLTLKDLHFHFDEMRDKSCNRIASLKQDYSYKLSGEEVVENTIMQLFDECFLAFDEPVISDE